MTNLIEKKEKIAYILRYASKQGWATELLEKEFGYLIIINKPSTHK